MSGARPSARAQQTLLRRGLAARLRDLTRHPRGHFPQIIQDFSAEFDLAIAEIETHAFGLGNSLNGLIRYCDLEDFVHVEGLRVGLVRRATEWNRSALIDNCH